jgi:hypothetical protein
MAKTRFMLAIAWKRLRNRVDSVTVSDGKAEAVDEARMSSRVGGTWLMMAFLLRFRSLE